MDGFQLNGNLGLLSVKDYSPPQKGVRGGDTHKYTNLYVKNFSKEEFYDENLIVWIQSFYNI